MLIQRKEHPVCAERFDVPHRMDRIDWPLVTGSIIFGVGASLSGLWPGIFGSVFASFQAVVFLLAVTAGIVCEKRRPLTKYIPWPGAQ